MCLMSLMHCVAWVWFLDGFPRWALVAPRSPNGVENENQQGRKNMKLAYNGNYFYYLLLVCLLLRVESSRQTEMETKRKEGRLPAAETAKRCSRACMCDRGFGTRFSN